MEISKHQIPKILEDAGEKVSLRTIQYYVDEGLIVPEIDNPSGRGVRRKYSRADMVDLLLVRKFAVHHGWSLSAVKRIMDTIRKSGIRRRYFDGGTATLVVYEPDSPAMTAQLEYRLPAETLKKILRNPEAVKKTELDSPCFEEAVVINLSKLASKIR